MDSEPQQTITVVGDIKELHVSKTEITAKSPFCVYKSLQKTGIVITDIKCKKTVDDFKSSSKKYNKEQESKSSENQSDEKVLMETCEPTEKINSDGCKIYSLNIEKDKLKICFIHLINCSAFQYVEHDCMNDKVMVELRNSKITNFSNVDYLILKMYNNSAFSAKSMDSSGLSSVKQMHFFTEGDTKLTNLSILESICLHSFKGKCEFENVHFEKEIDVGGTPENRKKLMHLLTQQSRFFEKDTVNMFSMDSIGKKEESKTVVKVNIRYYEQ